MVEGWMREGRGMNEGRIFDVDDAVGNYSSVLGALTQISIFTSLSPFLHLPVSVKEFCVYYQHHGPTKLKD